MEVSMNSNMTSKLNDLTKEKPSEFVQETNYTHKQKEIYDKY